MTVIDVHAHMATPELLQRITETGTSKAPAFEETEAGLMLRFGGKGGLGPIPSGIHDLSLRLADMDRQGVDLQVVAVAPILFGYDQPAPIGSLIARAINDSLIEMAAGTPDRFLVAATLPFQDVDASLEELERLSTVESVRALQIGSHIAGRNLDDPEFEPIWNAISRSGLGVVIHPYDVAGRDRMTRYHIVNLVGNPNDSTIAIASLIFGGVLERNPLPIVFVHGGGFAPYQIGRWDHGWRARTDSHQGSSRSPSQTLAGCFFDTLTHDDDSLRFLGQRVGWGQVMVGSDYPFDMAEPDPVVAIRRLGLDTEDERRVLESNARRFLSLEAVVS